MPRTDPKPDDGPRPLSEILGSHNIEPLRMAGAYADLSDSLYSVIDRADHRLAEIDCHRLAVDLGDLRIAGLELADRLILALNAVLDARAILAEAIPADEAAEEGGGDGLNPADREIIEALQELTPDVRRLETDEV